MAILYRTQIDHFEDLLLEYVETQTQHALCEHEYPHTSGANIEDTGEKARQFHFVVWFKKAPKTRGYSFEYAADFRAHLRQVREISFVHPKQGLVKGKVSALSERDEDLNQKVGFDITLKEHTVVAAPVQPYVDIVAALEDAYTRGIDEQRAAFETSLRLALGTEAQVVLQQTVTRDGAILAQFAGLSATARQYVSNIETDVRKAETLMTDWVTPAGSLVNTIDWAETLPDRVIGGFARLVERYALSLSALRNSPARFADSFFSSMDSLKAGIAHLADQFTFAAASYGSVALSEVYAAEEQQRDRLRSMEQQPSFDIAGNLKWVSEDIEIATADELEASLVVARRWLQAGVEGSRAMRSLQTMALALLTHVSTIKLERERIIEIEIDEPTPLHVICLQVGLPYSYAPRLLRLNRIQNPTFTSGRIRVYATAA